MAVNEHKVRAILDRLEELANRGGDVRVSDAVQAMGNRSFGPFLLLPAILELSPIGGIPGLPTVLAVIVAFFAGQLALGRKHVWVPKWLGRRTVSSDRVRKAVGAMRPFGDRLDAWFHGRLQVLTSGFGARIAGAAAVLLTLTVPPLELVPFASSGPMGAIAALGLALLVRDGVLVVVAGLIVVVAAAIGLGVVAW